MSNMKEATTTAHVHAIVYGEPKTGKSTFMGTFPEPAFLILTEPDKSQYIGKNIDFVELSPTSANAYDELIDIIEMLQDKMDSGNFPYQAVIVDSLTELAAIFEKRILSTNNREYKPFDKRQRKYDDHSMGMRIQDWGIFKAMLEQFTRNIHVLPCHTVMSAHEYVKESGDNKVLKGCLSISGNFGETGTKLFNTVLRSRAKTQGSNTRYYMQTKPAQLFTAGIWGNSLPLEWEDATFDALIKATK